MRQVFTSPRLENVERVAQMLNDEGIATHITNGRSYGGARRRQFSYRDIPGSQPQPALWIVHTRDQVRARELLRGAGLIDSTRGDTGFDSYLPGGAPRAAAGSPQSRRKAVVMRVRILMLAIVAAVVVAALYQIFGG
ncbi:pathogenicity-like protein [Coralloluteibacterium stylophorae]|uniref:Pathogenicity-like protein n=1 Tax=Coralloluteibacterium stylophorae TaxID=1776034 RepID=A0A8J7VQR4_9GAMM|nr:pathogenicity-like protein [Coralloluteibacterium stylophorae]MBS7456426.1 pathogenicity-like protein [Coralloluteibacterium stylophorae]